MSVVCQMMMELGKNVLARIELSTVYLATLKVAAQESISICLFPPIVPQSRSSYFHINYNSVSSDAAPIEEDFIEDDQPVDDNDVDDDDDEMADFIVEEDEIDGNGQVVRCGSLCSYLLPTASMSICDCAQSK